MISNLSSKESGCGCGSSGGTSAAPCSCGGAGCRSCVAQGIVRPRFFAGQLLTEDDLQLLTDYVGHKNRLHNRHLFGAGVVCGLEVTCDPCGDGRVIVHPGYAIDCCGNDLTLSCRQTVDLDAMVRKLLNECIDPCKETKKNKDKTDEEEKEEGKKEEKPQFHYCLYIRYCEQPSDPVTPYSTGEECVQLGCEATRIREGVSFELRCGEVHKARNPLIERLCMSFGDLDDLPKVFEAFGELRKQSRILASSKVEFPFLPRKSIGLPKRVISAPGGQTEGGSDLTQVSRRSAEALLAAKEPFKIVRDWLIERLSKSDYVTDCTMKGRVYGLMMPRSDDPTIIEINAGADSTKELMVLFIDYFRESVCRALNPACVSCDDSAVLLACLDWEDCEVKRICNTERNFVLSPAAVRYWLPPLQLIGNVLERLCCVPWYELPREPREPQHGNFNLPKEDQLGDPDLWELLKQEIARIVKDSACGISDSGLKSMMEFLDRIFNRDSNLEKSSINLNPPARPGVVVETPKEEPSAEDAQSSTEAQASSAAAATPKVSTKKKTGLKKKPPKEPQAQETTPPAETPKGDEK